MKKQFEKKVALFVFFTIISLFLFAKPVFALDRFTFTIQDVSTGNSASLLSDTPTVTLYTTATSLRITIEPAEYIEDGRVLEKVSYPFSNGWQGTQTIGNGGGMWTVSGLNSGADYTFQALIGASQGYADAIATINVKRSLTMTATPSCTPSTRVSLSWTSGGDSSVYYNVWRSDYGTTLNDMTLTQTTSTSFVDTTAAASTSYTYVVRAIQGGSYIPGKEATASTTTGACVSPLCGDGIVQPSISEQCDWGNSTSAPPNNGDVCTLQYGELQCTYCNTLCQWTNSSAGTQWCGDGILQNPPEQCDSGIPGGNSTCSSTCSWIIPNACSFSAASASWSTTTATNGIPVNMTLSGATNCNGQGVTFSITPSSGLSVSNVTGTISSNAVIAPWTAQYVSNGGNVYSFTARLTSNSSVSKASSNSLTLTTGGGGGAVCGDGTVTYPEACDGTNLNGKTCENLGWGYTGGTLSCYATGNPSGYVPCQFDATQCTATCGDGIIGFGEQCEGTNFNGVTCQSLGFGGGTLSCSSCQRVTSGCTNPPPTCVLTSAGWSATQATEGDTVSLLVQGTDCGGKTVSFVVKEYDLSGSDSVVTNPVNVTFSGNTASGSWGAEWQNDPAMGNNNPEYFFTATVATVGSVSSSTSDSLLLHVNQTNVSACASVSVCGDYSELTSCTLDQCSVADDSVPSSVNCSAPGISCSCSWNSGTSACDASVESTGTKGVIGLCTITQNSEDNCDDGFLTFSWTALWAFAPGKTAADDVNGLQAKCVDGSKTVECPAQIALSFINTYSIISVLVIIALIYWALSMRKPKKAKSSRKKRR